MQYGFGDDYPTGGKDWREKYRDATRALRLKGEFRDGLFIDTDPDTGEVRTRDGLEAAHEEYAGRRLPIPAAGYDAPILMHPGAFGYYEAEPGVEVKPLGRFFDYPGPNADVRISVLRLSGAGTFALGPERGQVAWSVSPGLRIDGRTYPDLTCLYSPLDEDVVAGLRRSGRGVRGGVAATGLGRVRHGSSPFSCTSRRMPGPRS